MKNTFLSRFTPSSMTPETLEAMFVQRHPLVEDLIAAIRESALTDNKHFRLLVGGRGMGKTHTVSLIYHRLMAMDDLKDKLVIAWLREEEWGVASFLDLLMRIFRALSQQYPEAYKDKLENEVTAIYQMSADIAQHKAAQLLREFVEKRTLVLLMENLDDIFNGLDDIGQKQFRAYLQNYPFITILATTQSLFNGVQHKESAFYGFFYSHYLEQLELDEVVDLLKRIAKLEGDKELESYIQSPAGKARIQAIHYLAGGNHRVYVIFAEFLTRKSLDELVEPFMKTLDELTPYYQARMQWLSPQQRKIVDFLVDRRATATVTEIAQHCFITHQTASSQLKDLRTKGYVRVEAIGRECYYELQEVLMRFCLDLKKQRGEPISLIVDFLRCWYTQDELKQRLEKISLEFDARKVDALYRKESHSYELEKRYIILALEKLEDKEQDPRVAACWQEIKNCLEQDPEDIQEALNYLDKITVISNDLSAWNLRGIALSKLGRYKEAITSWNRCLEINPQNALAWHFRGIALAKLERYEEAIASCDLALEINPKDGLAWYNRGIALAKLGRYKEAIASWNRCLEINPKDGLAWHFRGIALTKLGRYKEAITSWNRCLEINPEDDMAWHNRGLVEAELEIPSLFKNIQNEKVYRIQIQILLKRFEERKITNLLGSALVRKIPNLMPEMISNKAALTWLEAWQELTEDKTEFEIPLRLLNAAVRCKVIKSTSKNPAKDARRILLELPIEERNLLEPLLEINNPKS
jgi:tetratricopeptide (TPR) repeat protein